MSYNRNHITPRRSNRITTPRSQSIFIRRPISNRPIFPSGRRRDSRGISPRSIRTNAGLHIVVEGTVDSIPGNDHAARSGSCLDVDWCWTGSRGDHCWDGEAATSGGVVGLKGYGEGFCDFVFAERVGMEAVVACWTGFGFACN